MSRRLRLLLFGGSGQVGFELAQRLARSADIKAPGRADADLSQPEGLRAIVRACRPDIVVNAAAYTAVDRAEQEPERARAVNAAAPRVLAEECARLGALLVHYSTDYVFDGTARTPYVEDDEPRPLNVYGRTKLDGERAIVEAGGAYVIIRSSWVYASHGTNFLRTVQRLFHERSHVSVVSDQLGTPTSAGVVADGTITVLAAFTTDAQSGIYHLTGEGYTSWHGFAQAIHAGLARREALQCRSVVAVSSAEYPAAAKRPAWSVLNCTRITKAFGVRLRPWQEQLAVVLDEL